MKDANLIFVRKSESAPENRMKASEAKKIANEAMSLQSAKIKPHLDGIYKDIHHVCSNGGYVTTFSGVDYFVEQVILKKLKEDGYEVEIVDDQIDGRHYVKIMWG